MNYLPDYTIAEKNIPLLFNSWTYRTYCQKMGIEYEDLLSRIGEGTAFKAKHLPDLLLTAAESYARFNKLEFAYNADDAYTWIDTMGGFSSVKLAEVYKVFVAKMLNISPEQLEVLWNKTTEETETKEPAKKKPRP